MPQFRLEQLIQVVGGTFTGPSSDLQKTIRGVGPIHDAAPDSITWIADSKHSKHVASTEAAAIIGTRQLLDGSPKGIVVRDPETAIADVLDQFFIPAEPPPPGIHPMASVHSSAKLGADVRVGPFTVIHADVSIGDRTVIHEGVSIGRGVSIGSDCVVYDRCVLYDRTEIGRKVLLHAGAVIGADGFGYIFREKEHRRLAHLGNVIIEDDVEIGPNSVVDRGKLGPTRIGRGTKIDALVMVGHNVQIGPLCVLAGQAGLSGSVRLGTGVAVGGQVGFTQGVQVGDGVRVSAQSGVVADVAAGLTIMGMPAQEATAELRGHVRVRKLQKLFDQVAELARRVNALEAPADHREPG
jgi:UDP-3-O-[3-hydroxymyristoyl] glucosamine N-acyltransferase